MDDSEKVEKGIPIGLFQQSSLAVDFEIYDWSTVRIMKELRKEPLSAVRAAQKVPSVIQRR